MDGRTKIGRVKLRATKENEVEESLDYPFSKEIRPIKDKDNGRKKRPLLWAT